MKTQAHTPWIQEDSNSERGQWLKGGEVILQSGITSSLSLWSKASELKTPGMEDSGGQQRTR